MQITLQPSTPIIIIIIQICPCTLNFVCIKFLTSYIIVTEFAKRGLIHASSFLTLRICNSASIGPTALKFGTKPFLSLY